MCGSYCIAAASPLAGIGVRCTFVFGGWDSSHRTFLGLLLSSFRPADFRRSGLRLRGGTNSHGRCRRRWLSSLVSASVRTFTLPGRSPEAARFLLQLANLENAPPSIGADGFVASPVDAVLSSTRPWIASLHTRCGVLTGQNDNCATTPSPSPPPRLLLSPVPAQCLRVAVPERERPAASSFATSMDSIHRRRRGVHTCGARCMQMRRM